MQSFTRQLVQYFFYRSMNHLGTEEPCDHLKKTLFQIHNICQPFNLPIAIIHSNPKSILLLTFR